jgi:hypothetical protein
MDGMGVGSGELSGVMVSKSRFDFVLKVEQPKKHQAPKRALNEHGDDRPNAGGSQPTVMNHQSDIATHMIQQKQNGKMNEAEKEYQRV